MLLRNETVNQEIKDKIKRYMGKNENENIMFQNLWNTAKAVLRDDYSNTGLPEEEKSQTT